LQVDVIVAFVTGHNVFAVLYTGYRKVYGLVLLGVFYQPPELSTMEGSEQSCIHLAQLIELK